MHKFQQKLYAKQPKISDTISLTQEVKKMCAKSYLLKRLALQAKRRLISGVESNTYLCADVKNQNIKIFSNDEDEKFYKKVCQILMENPDVHNPIGKLIDNKVYNSLQSSSKEKYFFDLVDRYGECKTRFEKEHAVAI